MNWKKIALRLARAIIRYDNYPFAGGLSESAIVMSRKLTRRKKRV